MSIATTHKSAPGDVVSSETALACFFRLGAQNGVYAEIGAVRRRNLIEGDSLPVARLVELAGEFGLRAERVRLDWECLRNTPFSHPILLLLDNMNAVILVGVRRNGPEEVAVSDPVFRDGEPFFLAREDLERAWAGAALVVTPLPPTKADTAFGFSWFTTKLFAERRLMRDIVAAALVMHLIGLSVPIFFQLLVDKVVPNQAFSTLYALSAGVGVLILFDAGFNYLRNYLLASSRAASTTRSPTARSSICCACRSIISTPTRPGSPPTNCRRRITSGISWRAGCSIHFSIFSQSLFICRCCCSIRGS